MTSATLAPVSAPACERADWCRLCVIERVGSVDEQARALVLAGDLATVGAAPLSGLCPAHESARVAEREAEERRERDAIAAEEARQADALAVELQYIDDLDHDARRQVTRRADRPLSTLTPEVAREMAEAAEGAFPKWARR